MILFGLLVFMAGSLGILTLQACSAMGRRPYGKWLERVKASPHYQQQEFQNSQRTAVMRDGSFWRTMKQWVSGTQVRVPTATPPIFPSTARELSQSPGEALRVTWLGHATALVEIDGYRVLTDPMFSERVSPVSGFGPKRFFPAPIAASALLPLDAVVISHDHYDHLDQQSILDLAPRTKVFFVPLGVSSILVGWGLPEEKIVELDWWQQAKLGQLTLVSTPARHFSGRGLLDRNKTQWCTWAIWGPRHRVFFGGDTGLFPELATIGARLGPFALTLMPIGAYGPGWPLIHLNPEEAVRAQQMVRGELLLPTHWGTFNLALHAWTEPVERLVEAARAAGVALALPRPGEPVTLGQTIPRQRWWPNVPWERASAKDYEATVISSTAAIGR